MPKKKKTNLNDVRLFHVASLERLASIREKGLSGEFTKVRPGCVHLGASALQVGIYHGHWNEGASVLLSVGIGELDRSKLGPDREDLMDILDQNDDFRKWSDVGWLESLQLSGNCTYEGAIPASALRVETYVPDPDADNEFEIGLALTEWSGPSGSPAP